MKDVVGVAAAGPFLVILNDIIMCNEWVLESETQVILYSM